MPNKELQEKIDSIAEQVVLAEPEEKSIMELHTALRDFARAAEEAGFADGAQKAHNGAKIAERILVGSESEAAANLEKLGEMISSLQMEVANLDRKKASGGGKGKQSSAGQSGDAPEEDASDNNAELRHPSSLPSNVDTDIFAEFLGRQSNVLEEMEEHILAWEQSGAPEELTKLRRLFHTMKGESGLLGLEEVQKLCHNTETLLEKDEVREGMADILLSVKDWLNRAFRAYAGDGIPPGPVDVLIELLDNIDFSKKGAAPNAEAEETEAREYEEAGPDLQTDKKTEDNTEDNDDNNSNNDSNVDTDSSGAAEKDADYPLPEPLLLQNLDVDLLKDFISEASEHLDSVELHMLTLETSPEDLNSLNTVFRAFHTIKGVAGYLSLEQIGTLAHDVETMLDRARKGDLRLVDAYIDLVFETVDKMKALVDAVRDALENGERLEPDPTVGDLLSRVRLASEGKLPKQAAPRSQSAPGKGKKIGEILVAAGNLSRKEIQEELRKQKSDPNRQKLGEMLVKNGEASPQDISHALRQQREEEPAQQEQRHVQVREAIKVDADRLDRLVDTIGELVITESMVSNTLRGSDDMNQALHSQLGQLDKITRQLQEMSTSLRMVPVRATFQKMARLVRDLSKKSGKNVRFVMKGEDTELDKTVVDRIGDPLVHMIRNAVDHGIEHTVEERQALEKPEAGIVELNAYHRGGNIYIDVSDDGRGLDREAIAAKARKNGLIEDDARLTDNEVFSLVFEPGFSTAKQVTDVSGRGIGMDVVKRNIVDNLRGSIDIQSEPGRGSVFSIRLPLTLAIIDGMLVGVGKERYIIPTLSIVRSLRPGADMLSTVQGKGIMLRLDDREVPLFRLHQLFSVEGAVEDIHQALVVIVESEGMYTGVVVDELLGQQQIVIKTLGKALQDIPGVAGSTILSDGLVGLILDVSGLVKLANRERLAAASTSTSQRAAEQSRES